MGKLKVLVGLLVTVGMVSACQKKEDPAPAPVVVSPSPNCINGQVNCNNGYYNQYSQYGFMPYPVNPYNYSGGYYGYWNSYYSYYGYSQNNINFCACPAGYRPVYNGGWGLGCVSNNYFQPFIGGAYYYGLQPNNYQWVNISQVSNVSGYPTGNNCYSSVAMSCLLNQANVCPSGTVCRPSAPGSALGICAR